MATPAKPRPAFKPPPQLNYALGNPHSPGTIYVSGKASDNQLSLAMSSTVAATFTPGTLVPPAEAAKGTGSLLYLDVTPLGLTAAEFEALAPAAPGWAAQRFSEAQSQYLGLTPTAPVSLAPAPATIGFALDGFTMARQPGASASLHMLAYRVGGITSGAFPVSGSIAVVFALPAGEQDELSSAIEVELTPAQVVASVPESPETPAGPNYPEVVNHLLLTLTQKPDAAAIDAGPNTSFTLSFVCSGDPDGFGALLTVEEAEQVSVTAGQDTTDWDIVPNLKAQTPYWTLTPPPGALFSPGAGSTLEIEIGGLVTTFQPGPTEVLLGYSGIPGYRNGSFALTVVKEPHVLISSFAATPPRVELGAEGPVDVRLDWTTTHATQLTLRIDGDDFDVTGKTSHVVNLSDTTDFQLTANGDRPGGADNQAIWHLSVPVLPVIETFEVWPRAVYADHFDGETAHPVTLSWKVTTNAESVLIDDGGPSPQLHAPNGPVQTTIKKPTTFTLKAKAGSAGPEVARDAVVAAFTVETVEIPVPTDMPLDWAAMPPGTAFAAAGNVHGIYVMSGPDYSQTAELNPSVPSEAGFFSADGATLFASSYSTPGLDIYSVGGEPGAPTFRLRQNIAFPSNKVGAPLLGSDGTIWVATQGTILMITETGGSYAVTGSLPIGGSIHQGAWLTQASNGDVFVADSDSQSIARIIVDRGIPSASVVISGLDAERGLELEPIPLAVTADGGRLLVSYPGKDMVCAYDLASASRPPEKFEIPEPWLLGTVPASDCVLVGSSSGLFLLNHVTGQLSNIAEAVTSMAMQGDRAVCTGMSLKSHGLVVQLVSFPRTEPRPDPGKRAAGEPARPAAAAEVPR